MLDEYLIKQNRFLSILGIFLFIMSITLGVYIAINQHLLFAVLQFSITLGFISGIVKTIRDNIIHIHKWESINKIEVSSYPIEDDDGIKIMRSNVGNLNFKFTRD